jgi:hypothetical protein
MSKIPTYCRFVSHADLDAVRARLPGEVHELGGAIFQHNHHPTVY